MKNRFFFYNFPVRRCTPHLPPKFLQNFVGLALARDRRKAKLFEEKCTQKGALAPKEKMGQKKNRPSLLRNSEDEYLKTE